MTAILLVLMLSPLGKTFFSLDDGSAYAQTGPPPEKTSDPNPPPTLTPEITVTVTPITTTIVITPPIVVPPSMSSSAHGCSTGCIYPIPTDIPVVDIEYLATPPPGIPPLEGEGVIVRVPSGEESGFAEYFGYQEFVPSLPNLDPVIPITQGAIPVPSGYITQPIGLIPFDFGPAGFRELGSLIVPTKLITDLIVRIEIVPRQEPPIPFDNPNIIPLDWYADPHNRQLELGYGAPIPILSPGVTESNYDRVAQKVGLPPTPVPTPDTETAGVLETYPYTGTQVAAEAVFKLSVYNGITGEEITIHLPELVLVRCFEDIYDPYTPVLLHADMEQNKYDLPVQAYDQLLTSDLPERVTGYLLDTQNTFVVATLSGNIRPPLLPNQPQLIPNPFARIPAPPNNCACEVQLPPGMPITRVDYLTTIPSNIPPLIGNGVVARIRAAKPISPPLAAIPVPSGLITEPIGIVYFDLRPEFRAYGTLIVPAEPDRDLIVRIQNLTTTGVRIPITSTNVIPTDWYVVPHEQVWPELGYGGPIPIMAPGVITSNYQRVAEIVGAPVTPIPPPNAAKAGVIETMPLEGETINVEAVFDIDVYYADTGEEISIHLPELILGDICFERNFSPHTPVLLRTNEQLNRYDVPVHQHYRYWQNYVLPERITAYLLETSRFVFTTVSGQVRPLVTADEEYTGPIIPSYIPAGLPNTGASTTTSEPAALWWGILLLAGGVIVILARFTSRR